LTTGGQKIYTPLASILRCYITTQFINLKNTTIYLTTKSSVIVIEVSKMGTYHDEAGEAGEAWERHGRGLRGETW
jgi:hypothetical protein